MAYKQVFHRTLKLWSYLLAQIRELIPYFRLSIFYIIFLSLDRRSFMKIFQLPAVWSDCVVLRTHAAQQCSFVLGFLPDQMVIRWLKSVGQTLDCYADKSVPAKTFVLLCEKPISTSV